MTKVDVYELEICRGLVRRDFMVDYFGTMFGDFYLGGVLAKRCPDGFIMKIVGL